MNASSWIALATLVGAALVGSVKLLWMAATFFKGMRDDLHNMAVDIGEHIRKDEVQFETLNDEVSVLKLDTVRIKTHLGLEQSQ